MQGTNFSHRIAFSNLEWHEAGDGMRYKLSPHGDMQVRLVEWDKSMLHAAWCLKGHIGYVIEGEMDIDYSGTVEHYGPGDCLLIPEGETHM